MNLEISSFRNKILKENEINQKNFSEILIFFKSILSSYENMKLNQDFSERPLEILENCTELTSNGLMNENDLIFDKKELHFLMNDKYVKRIELLHKELAIKIQDFFKIHDNMIRNYKDLEEKLVFF